MIAEVISIGDELLNGRTINNNAAFIGRKLTEIGIDVAWITTVGDWVDRMADAFALAKTRADVIVATGGLGPTHDDVTREAVCKVFNTELQIDSQVLTAIVERFESRGLEMPEVNRGQALVPVAADIIHNKIGTAPGFIFRTSKSVTYVLPGVPAEMKSMMETAILPELLKHPNRQCIQYKTIRTTGIAESMLFEKISNFDKIKQLVKVSFLPGPEGVDIRLMASGRDDKTCQTKIESALALLQPSISPFIYNFDNVSLAQTVAQLLMDGDFTLAVAESCTGGLLAHQLTNISGSSKYFERGVVSYSNRSKMEILGVPEETIRTYGAVSGPTAIAMAEGVRRTAGTDFGLSTTGIAGPTGGSPEKPVGLVFIAFASKKSSFFEQHIFKFDRVDNKLRFAQAALNLLRKQIKAQIDAPSM